jgi:hypothetical protein
MSPTASLIMVVKEESPLLPGIEPHSSSLELSHCTDSIMNIATRPPAERPKSPRFDFRQDQEIFLSRWSLGPT